MTPMMMNKMKKRPLMPPPEMPAEEPPAPKKEASFAERLTDATNEQSAETPASGGLAAIADRYGLSESEAKAFLREAMESLCGGEEEPEPEPEPEPLGGETPA